MESRGRAGARARRLPRARAAAGAARDAVIDERPRASRTAVAFEREGRARYTWSAAKRRFELRPGGGYMTEAEIRAFSGGDMRVFVEANYTQLAAFAARGKEQREAVRRFLERFCVDPASDDECRQSPRAAALFKLLK